MADQLLEKVRDIVEGPIDFEGQKTAERLATELLIFAGGIAFLTGYFLQHIKLALQIGLAGAVITALIVVPPWPFFNKHPILWLPVARSEIGSHGITVERSEASS